VHACAGRRQAAHHCWVCACVVTSTRVDLTGVKLTHLGPLRSVLRVARRELRSLTGPRVAIPQEPFNDRCRVSLRCATARFHASLRNEESAFERTPPISSGGRTPLKSHSSERPNSREDKLPLTGNQARKDLIESEPPERETRKAERSERKPERHRGNRTRKSLIESETQDRRETARRKA
jgi:hypothetical protein